MFLFITGNEGCEWVRGLYDSEANLLAEQLA
jgi:hypothetical protein